MGAGSQTQPAVPTARTGLGRSPAEPGGSRAVSPRAWCPGPGPSRSLGGGGASVVTFPGPGSPSAAVPRVAPPRRARQLKACLGQRGLSPRAPEPLQARGPQPRSSRAGRSPEGPGRAAGWRGGHWAYLRCEFLLLFTCPRPVQPGVGHLRTFSCMARTGRGAGGQRKQGVLAPGGRGPGRSRRCCADGARGQHTAPRMCVMACGGRVCLASSAGMQCGRPGGAGGPRGPGGPWPWSHTRAGLLPQKHTASGAWRSREKRGPQPHF